MVALPSTSSRDARPLTVADLERVIAIDRVHTGHSRRHFFEKRFAAAKKRPDDFLHVGAMVGGMLQGFAIARILRGEFGHKDAVAVLDAVGVDAENRERGIGQSLMEELIKMSRKHGVRSLHSEAGWTNHDLLRFFDAACFELAPRLALERPIAELYEEAGEEI